MSPDRDQRLIELAKRLTDGQSIDWKELQEREPDLAAYYACFRQLERIASAHSAGRLPGIPDEPEDSHTSFRLRVPLFEWGSIQVLEKLGEGGFAEVYRAWDPSLEREVALKLIRRELASGATRIQRWVEEARRLARVRHPNVLVVHGVDVRDGRAGIWTDLIHGRTLERVLQEQGRLGGGEAALIGLDLCRALAAVHVAGLVHGDLKTTNVMREGGADSISGSGAGRIVLMDFGASDETSPSEQHSMPFVTPLTCAPEVMRGEAPTPSSDLYSLGVLLYRLVAGRHPIESSDWTELQAKVQRGASLPIRDVRPDLGPTFVALVERALEPDPARRFSSPGHMERALRSALKEETEILTASPVSSIGGARTLSTAGTRLRTGNRLRVTMRLRRRVATTVLASILALGVIGTLFGWLRSGDHARMPLRFTIQAPGLHLAPDPNQLAISPDGTTLAFIASDSTNRALWVRRLGDFDVRELRGTVGAQLPFWSPDNRSLGFFSDGSLKRVRLDGDVVTVICAAPHPRGGSWGRKGTIVFAANRSGPLARVLASGGSPRAVTTLDSAAGEIAHRWPCFLPDGEHFLYTAVRGDTAKTAILPVNDRRCVSYIGSIVSGRSRRLLAAHRAPIYAHPGHLIYARDDALVAQRFDPRGGAIRGEAFRIADSPMTSPLEESPCASVSANGVLAWRPAAGLNTRLTWLSRTGQRLRALGVRPDHWRGARISPDGRRAVLLQGASDHSDLWLLDFEREVIERLTYEQGDNFWGAWSPDGKQIVYTSNREGDPPVLYRRAVDAGSDQVFYRSAAPLKSACDWSPDGKWVVIKEFSKRNSWDLLRVPAAGGAAIPFVATPFNDDGARISPDGKRALYLSDEGGAPRAYVQSFPVPTRMEQVSRVPVLSASWANGGREILLIGTDLRLRSVAVGPGEGRFSSIRELFQFPAETDFVAPTPDGKRFLLFEPTEPPTPGVSIAVNWAAGR